MNEFTTNIKDGRGVSVTVYKQYLAALKEQGCSGEIIIRYYGHDDSGDFADAVFSNPQIESITQQLGYAWGYASCSYIDSDGFQVECDDYKKCLMTYARTIPPYGWEIDEGSIGNIVLNIDDGSVVLNHGYANSLAVDYNDPFVF